MNVIDETRVDLLMFNDDMNTIYIAKQNVVSQFSINAVRLRIFDFGSRVTAFGVLGVDFQFDQRLVVAGLSDGSVSVVCTDFESRKLVERERRKMSAVPITTVLVRPRSCVVHVYDAEYDEPQKEG
jgi:hypothetical protein